MNFLHKLELNDTEQSIARDILKEIKERLEFFKKCGLNYFIFESF